MREKNNFTWTEKLYKNQYDHTKWWDHKVRIPLSITFISSFFQAKGIDIFTIADLACGDGAIPIGVAHELGSSLILNDYAEPPEPDVPSLIYHADMYKVVERIPKVDLIILSEVLEHLDNPDLLLEKVRAKTDYLFISTPLLERENINPEHVWRWDDLGMGNMFSLAGFESICYGELNLGVSNFQLWLCQ